MCQNGSCLYNGIDNFCNSEKTCKNSNKKTEKNDSDFINDYRSAEELIDEISLVRRYNNECWMDILKIAFKSDPENCKIIFQRIVDNDKIINEISKELCK